MRFPRQWYWSGLLFSSPGDLLNPGTEPGSPTCRQILHCLSHQECSILLCSWGLKLWSNRREVRLCILVCNSAFLPKQCIQTYFLLQCTKFIPYLYGSFLVWQNRHGPWFFKKTNRDFPGSPVVKNLPSNAGLIPGGGTTIPHAKQQLSPHPTTRELSSSN